MKRFWISWYTDNDMGPFELNSPWWISGTDGICDSVCAAVIAEDEDAARCVVLGAYDICPLAIDWRFCQERDANWAPFCERFPQADWMQWPGN
jgi:hypothetical protein